MKYKKPRRTVRTGPEDKGSRRLRLKMQTEGWYVKKLHGGKYQSGLPDLVAMHPIHGLRWIEMKAPGGKLRSSQIHTFNLFEKHGQEVYVLESEKDYRKLFNKKGNWLQYVRGLG